MGRVIVNKNFIQKEGDKIVFDSPDFCEIETEDSSFYSGTILTGMDDFVYEAKMNFCIKRRQEEYAKLNQFAMQFDDSVNGTTTWIDAINEIKAKYQKPVKRNL